jgi:hypothetical protein
MLAKRQRFQQLDLSARKAFTITKGERTDRRSKGIAWAIQQEEVRQHESSRKPQASSTWRKLVGGLD